jgi:HEAT repeat protein
MRSWMLHLALLAAIPGSRPMLAAALPTDPVLPAAFATHDDDGPADSLYKSAREALNRNQYRRAADLFAELSKRYPKSSYASDALYWEAFALYRTGGTEDLKAARARLETQKAMFPKSATRGDADALAIRIQTELAQRGDQAAAISIERSAQGAGSAHAEGGGTDCDDDSDLRIAALNGLLQMDADRALPILGKVLARRDPGSECLRRKAVFLIAQKRTENTVDQLLSAARNDPDAEVRSQAVFWLSQVPSPRAIAALDSIARRSTNPDLQDKAVFALSQQHDPAATKAMREIAESRDMNRDIREKAIFWLGQSKSGGTEYLKGLYARLDDDDLRQKVIFGVGQSRTPEDRQWLFDLAKNEKNPLESRKQAIFWAAQAGATANDLGALYGSLQTPELREQTIFALSQTKDPAAVDRLVAIARKDSDPEMRKKALFWLSQLHDPRVADILEQMLNE